MTSKRFGFALMLLVLSAAFLLAAAKTPVGTWECVSVVPGGGSSEMAWTLNLREVDGKLVGTAANDQGEVAIDDAKFDNDTLTFSVSLDSGTYEISLKVDDDKLDGNWKGGGETGTIKGTRKA
ncbi:MAG TPA: hypothetical protein VHA11_14920 [Bryobacteraceae bacterium]|nr:hypothetical protein [Bryobacteraceae bacterium]